MDVPHVWGHNSETKAQIKNPKTCGPSKWPPLAKGMPYSWVRNVSIEKPQDNCKTGYRNIILEMYFYSQMRSHSFVLKANKWLLTQSKRRKRQWPDLGVFLELRGFSEQFLLMVAEAETGLRMNSLVEYRPGWMAIFSFSSAVDNRV